MVNYSTWIIGGIFISNWRTSTITVRETLLLKYGSYLMKQFRLGGIIPQIQVQCQISVLFGVNQNPWVHSSIFRNVQRLGLWFVSRFREEI